MNLTGNYIPIMKKLFTLLLGAIFIAFSGCQSNVEEVKQRPSAIQVASDPSNYGYHSIGQTDGMCYGFAINLMNRLNNETDAHAWIMLVAGVGDPQPTAPDSEPNPFTHKRGIRGFWGHALVLFTTDGKLYAMDENVNSPVEINLNKVDWTIDDPAVSLADVVVKELWATLPHARYPMAWDNFRASAPAFEYGKQDVFNDFGKDADAYFTMQNHAYYFPPDWCVD